MIHIAIATDDTYVPWAATLMRSVMDHQDDVAFHVLGETSPGVVGRLRTWVEEAGASFHAYDVEQLVEGLPAFDRFSRIVWSRFFLPRLLPGVDRILYLDADTFVVAPLDELWETDLGSCVLGAVANVLEPEMFGHARELGVDPHRFLNSGVLLMDLEKLRAEDPVDRLRSFLERTDVNIVWPDQDALNVLYEGRWLPLHARWNAMYSLWIWRAWAAGVFGADVVDEATRSPAVVHFEGPTLAKPWHRLNTHPLRDAYLATVRRTPWPNPRVEGTAADRLTSLLPERMWFDVFVRRQRLAYVASRLARRVAKGWK